jgi:tetratricopeptide (TPR) repeat protein
MNTQALFSAHQDVLQTPLPATVPEQERLWQELKNRAKGAVGSGQWPDALHLYNKALEVVDAAVETAAKGSTATTTSSSATPFYSSQEQAVLRSNLSLVHSKMHDWDAAVESARLAVAADASYVKAWWRLSQAQAGLKNPAGAIHALEQGLALEPDNKPFQKELEKMQQMKATNMEDAFAAVLGKRTTTKPVVPSSSSTAPPAPTTTKTTTTAAAAPSPSQPDVKGLKVSDTDDPTKKSDDGDMKGYKIVNGKKTSYFNNELSPEAAALIGDIAPKKLDTAGTTGTNKDGTAAADGDKATSAWNTAGTWEERDVTAWAIPSLQEQLTQTTYQLPASSPAPGATVCVTAAVVTGHASVATVRGKKRFLYEFAVVIDWKLTEHVVASGSLTFPDVDGTCVLGEPYDCTDFVVRHMDDATMRPVLDAFVYRAGLRDVLHESIDAWVRLFREKYA